MNKRMLFPVFMSEGIKITADSFGRKQNIFKHLTPEAKREYASNIINNAGTIAAEIARSPSHSPYLTGRLVGSIKWEPSRSKISIQGALSVNVPYGRIQEFAPFQPKRLYLYRALKAVEPFIKREFRKFLIDKDAIITRKFRYPNMK